MTHNIQHVKIDCPDCTYHVEGVPDSKFGERAADILDEHAQKEHGCRFPKWKV